MKIAKRLCMTLTIAFIAIGAFPVQAAPVKTPTPATPTATPVTPVTPAKTSTTTSTNVAGNTTVSGIQFKEDEFVRITQPTFKNGLITFESQLNVIGEARVSTTLKIKVVYENGDVKIYDELKPVGVTQTFNQLIDLQVGKNVIVISASHKDAKDIEDIKGTVMRESEQTKEDLKNYIVQQNPIINSTTDKSTGQEKTPIPSKTAEKQTTPQKTVTNDK